MKKTMKKSISIIMAVMMIFSCFALCASAYTFEGKIVEFAQYEGNSKLDKSMFLLTTTALKKLNKNSGSLKIYYSSAKLEIEDKADLDNAVAEGRIEYVKELSANSVSLYLCKEEMGKGNLVNVDFGSANLSTPGYYYVTFPDGLFMDKNGEVVTVNNVGSTRFIKRTFNFLDIYGRIYNNMSYLVLKAFFSKKLA